MSRALYFLLRFGTLQKGVEMLENSSKRRPEDPKPPEHTPKNPFTMILIITTLIIIIIIIITIAITQATTIASRVS